MNNRITTIALVCLSAAAASPTAAQQQVSPNMPDRAAAPTPGEKPGVAPAICEPEQADFGVVLPGVNKSMNLRVRNTSGERLTVRAAVSNCACTAVSVPRKIIEPSDWTPLIVSVDMPKSLGRLRREVRVFLEGYQAPLIIPIAAEVSYPVRVNKGDFPEILNLKGVVRLDALDGQPFRVISASGQPAKFVGFDPANDQPRAEYTIEYDWSGVNEPDLPRYLVIQTDRADAELIDVKINSPKVWERWRPARQWRVNDDRVILGTLSAGASAEFVQTLTLPLDPKLPPTVECADAAYKIEVLSAKPGALGPSTTDVTLRLTPPPTANGFFHTILTFKAAGGASSVDAFGVIRK